MHVNTFEQFSTQRLASSHRPITEARVPIGVLRQSVLIRSLGETVARLPHRSRFHEILCHRALHRSSWPV
jgi:hypothetical protein